MKDSKQSEKWKLSQLVKKAFRKKSGVKPEYYANIDGEFKSLKEWSEFFGVSYELILSRYHRGVEGRALIAPPRQADQTKNYINNTIKHN